MHRTSFTVGVMMERRLLANRWQSVQWTPIAVDPDAGPADSPQLHYSDAQIERWLHAGFELRLYPDEAEGYFLNCTTAEPAVFVAWRLEGDVAVPWAGNASYNEAARLLDSGEEVQGVPMPKEILREVSAFVSLHYKPGPKKRSRPPSFKGAQRDE